MDESAIAFAIPVFLILIGVELAWSRHIQRAVYRFEDAIASIDCGIVQQVGAIFVKGIVIGIYAWLYENFAILAISPDSAFAWIALFFGVDFAYYAFHRASHRVNFVWATHVVHHQSEDYNLSTALRQSALQGVMSAAFYWPLALLGFPPAMFVAMATLNTLYQFWIHTRLVGKLGPLEFIFNTPSHHRVHHGIDPIYIDKNYAGILIIWDRLLGTFQEELHEPSYGTVKPLSSWNPIWANLDSWVHLARQSAKTGRLQDKLWIWLAPPEWQPADLGGPMKIPEVEASTRALYATRPNAMLNVYLIAQFLAVVGAVAALLMGLADTSAQTVVLAIWIISSTTSWSGLFERRAWAFSLELTRLALLGPIVAMLAPNPIIVLIATLFGALSMGALLLIRAVR